MNLLITTLLGLIFGSFVTCAAHRIPLGQQWLTGASRCPKCRRALGLRDLFPVFSWLASRGKCRHCHASVSVRYPLTELATAALFVHAYLVYGTSIATLLVMGAAVWLMIMIVVDLEHYIIPDSVHVALIPLALAFHYVQGSDLTLVALGAAAGLGLGLLLHHGYRFVRGREGLGFGDVKFLFVAGLWLGIYAFVPFLFFSGLLGVVLGLVWRKLGRGALFPFGPALALALWVGVLHPSLYLFLLHR